ncbi:MAG: malonyl-[acyl-carrier protein] O-methyltransferase BioC [Salinicola sp.]|uniref:methyltransferase domain-containing protein n=1 Tax=uncultured Salinicola sp. TaxID=1193542 RepID=UPI000C966768|nr:methyltransferase domain-containing protein [uncultured Salinicola sp.]MAM58658.1 malonyl-[acyl-carrier protein] O-methyltransferase BioC [Salinicola sp.]
MTAMTPPRRAAAAGDSRRQRIADAFSRAAAGYDGAAQLQQAVADDLLTRLPQTASRRALVDIGCGTGYLVSRLAERHDGPAIGLDIAPGMLDQARRRHAGRSIHWVTGCAESLPLAAGSVELVVSSLAVQWCDSLEAFLREAARVLVPGGWLGFTTLCEGTLVELQQAWQQVDGAIHVNEFLPEARLFETLRAPGWRPAEVVMTTRRTHHATPADTLRALKRIGANTITASAAAGGGLSGRRRFARLAQTLERWREPAGIPTRYRVATVLMQRHTQQD